MVCTRLILLAVVSFVLSIPLSTSARSFDSNNSASFDYLPVGSGELVNHAYYSLSYIETHEVSEWVAHKLTHAMINGSTSRTNDYRKDPLVSTESASPTAYQGSGYDRGHLVPAADMKLNHTAMSESFYMSNLAPQLPGFNREIWLELEQKIRSWVDAFGTMYVVTGPVLHSGLTQLPPQGVSVPEQFYKIILDLKRNRMIAFLLDNASSQEPLESFVVSVDYVENLTGVDFFPALPDCLEDYLEAYSFPGDWQFSSYQLKTNHGYTPEAACFHSNDYGKDKNYQH